jgi:signal transduction histidine kinase
MSTRHAQLTALAAYLAERRDDIMEAWRDKVIADPTLTSGAALPKVQLQDHLPALLDDFERKLVADDSAQRSAALAEQKNDAAAHGLHRWQQGFDLIEVSRELGRLNECVIAELDRCARAEIEPTVMAEARRRWAELYSVAIGASISRYFALQQLEAAGHVAELEQALESLRGIEAQRAELWQQAAHDLRGNLGVVAMATAGLTSAKASQDARERFLVSLDRNVRALHRLLEDVTSLARLQSGKEQRALSSIDAAGLLRDFAEGARALALDRDLQFSFDGPESLVVDGDAPKILRIVQNLVFNAIKYTDEGGVSLNWGGRAGDDSGRWFIQVTDSGPGFHAGPGSALAGALGVATAQAKRVEAGDGSGQVTHAKAAKTTVDTRPPRQQEGEGIGLSIVKGLCAVLDATIEVDSKIDQGTTVRILLPKRYAS